ncbi:MAG: hypothetical protein ACJ705_05615 [Nitrososphaeraceae archaeon]
MTRDSIMYTTNQTNHVHYMSYTPSPFVDSLLLMTILLSHTTSSPMVCRNICERIYSKEITFGKSNYSLGKKYCRRCEVYLYYNESMFCPCCGMQLRLTPSNREGKERLRQQRRLIKIRN